MQPPRRETITQPAAGASNFRRYNMKDNENIETSGTETSGTETVKTEPETGSEFDPSELKEVQKQMLEQLTEINKQLTPDKSEEGNPSAYFNSIFEEVKK